MGIEINSQYCLTLGDTGGPGPKGERGINVEVKGDKGARGVVGQPGDAGPRGDQGVPGSGSDGIKGDRGQFNHDVQVTSLSFAHKYTF